MLLGSRGSRLGRLGTSWGGHGIRLGSSGMQLGERGKLLGRSGVLLGFQGVDLGGSGALSGVQGVLLGSSGMHLGSASMLLGPSGILSGVSGVLLDCQVMHLAGGRSPWIVIGMMETASAFPSVSRFFPFFFLLPTHLSACPDILLSWSGVFLFLQCDTHRLLP